MRTEYAEPKNVPLRGGAITAVEPPLLPYGGFSAMQNIRNSHPGLQKRLGQIRLHTEADGTNKVVSLYQFKKTVFSETYFFAQMSDGDVLEGTTAPPGVTTGAFGSSVFAGTATGMKPASWGNMGDHMIFSNGSDQHKIYGGDENYVRRFVKFDGSAAPPDVPELGFDYTTEVTDGSTTTVAVLDSLNTYANHECIFICTPVPVNGFKFTVSAGNGNAATSQIYYRKNDNTWASASITDGTLDTATETKTLNKTGSMTWTLPSDEIPFYMYGIGGFWYRLQVSAALDAGVEISSVTYAAPWQNIRNVWNGVLKDAIEVYIEGTTQYETYGAGAVDLDELASGKNIYIVTSEPACGFYIDVGAYPNATGTALSYVKYWDGDSWVDVGTEVDSTSGLSNSGFITFPLQTAVQPLQFEGSQYYAYVYQIAFDAQLAADMLIGISYIPYYDINDFGRVGNCNCAWKSRNAVTFKQYPEYVYFSETYSPMVFNGSDFGIIEVGDGRSNAVVAMRRFYNELLVWQEEKGPEGGCITMIQGYGPTTFGKLVLSTRVGTFSNKTVDVVDGVLTSTATDESLKTLAFFLSRYGVFVTDGTSVSCISDDVQNYFDPSDSNSIRRGYENEHWLAHDSQYNVIRVGLVTGSSATVPNTFLAFDLADKTWSVDSITQPLAFAGEVGAESGTAPVVQVGGGTADGFVYLLNSGTNDVSTAINSYVTIEFGGQGSYINLRELNVRCKAQAAGNITLDVYDNEISKVSAKTLSMVAEVTNQTTRRHRVPLNITSQHIAVKLSHNTVSQEMYLYDLGVNMARWEGR